MKPSQNKPEMMSTKRVLMVTDMFTQSGTSCGLTRTGPSFKEVRFVLFGAVVCSVVMLLLC